MICCWFVWRAFSNFSSFFDFKSNCLLRNNFCCFAIFGLRTATILFSRSMARRRFLRAFEVISFTFFPFFFFNRMFFFFSLLVLKTFVFDDFSPFLFKTIFSALDLEVEMLPFSSSLSLSSSIFPLGFSKSATITYPFCLFLLYYVSPGLVDIILYSFVSFGK